LWIAKPVKLIQKSTGENKSGVELARNSILPNSSHFHNGNVSSRASLGLFARFEEELLIPSDIT
jgi:hypothetical protein